MTTSDQVFDGPTLKRSIRNDRPSRLLAKWAPKPFYTLFTAGMTGRERPFITPYGRAMAVLITLNKAEAETLRASFEKDKKGRHLVVKAVPLWELARYAHAQNGTLAWAREGVLFPEEAVDLLAHQSPLPTADDADALIRVEVIPLDPGGQSPLVSGDLQWWARGRGPEAVDHQFIYNDHHPWTDNPAMLRLPSSARPLSSLSPDERHAFSRWASTELPLFHPEDLDEADAEVASALPPHQWLPESRLAGPRKFHDLVNRQALSDPQQFMLEVTPKQISWGDGQDGNRLAERVGLTFIYLDQSSGDGDITPKLIAEASVTAQELVSLPCSVPTTPGMHKISEPLLGLVKRRLAWELFASAKTLDEGALPIQSPMSELLLARSVNDDSVFVCDPADARFPFLAGFRWGKELTPVMVLGQHNGNLACQPLVNLEIPQGSIPESLPGRQLPTNGEPLTVPARSQCLLIPQHLIECPEGWYEGARVSPMQTVQTAYHQMVSISRPLPLVDQRSQHVQRTKGAKLLAWVSGIVAFALIGAVLMDV